jgi:hypothetical protein
MRRSAGALVQQALRATEANATANAAAAARPRRAFAATSGAKPKALYAEEVFLPKGPINAGRFNLVREIAIGTGLGLVAGMAWKMYHWGEKRKIATFYRELAEKESAEEAAHDALVAEKMAALKEELLK